MAKYLLHRRELTIIQDAVVEYQRNHCGPNCPNATNCTDSSFCSELDRDISIGEIDRIEFYENDPRLEEAMEQLGKLGEHQPRWQND